MRKTVGIIERAESYQRQMQEVLSRIQKRANKAIRERIPAEEAGERLLAGCVVICLAYAVWCWTSVPIRWGITPADKAADARLFTFYTAVLIMAYRLARLKRFDRSCSNCNGPLSPPDYDYCKACEESKMIDTRTEFEKLKMLLAIWIHQKPWKCEDCEGAWRYKWIARLHNCLYKG